MCKYVLLYLVNSCYKLGEHNVLPPSSFFFELIKLKWWWAVKELEYVLYIEIIRLSIMQNAFDFECS
jgi:hypothetical protein